MTSSLFRVNPPVPRKWPQGRSAGLQAHGEGVLGWGGKWGGILGREAGEQSRHSGGRYYRSTPVEPRKLGIIVHRSEVGAWEALPVSRQSVLTFGCRLQGLGGDPSVPF